MPTVVVLSTGLRLTLVDLRCIIYIEMVPRLESKWPNRRETIIEKSGAGYGNVNNRRRLWRIEKGDCENRVQGACVVAGHESVRVRMSQCAGGTERMRTVRFLFELERGCCVWEVEEGVIWVSEANKIIKVKRCSCYALVLSPKDADDMVQPGVWARTV